jgi:hypothetical protein
VHFSSLYLHHIGLVYNVFLHQSSIIHAFLDNFRDFPMKSPLWYLISGRQKISYFRILMFQGSSGPQFDWGFLKCNILSREAPGEVVAHEGSHEAQTRQVA